MNKIMMFALLFMMMGFPVEGGLSLPEIFDSQMVLQRQDPIGVWGVAGPNTQVQVQLISVNSNGVETGVASSSDTADSNGAWDVVLTQQSATPAGEHHVLLITSGIETIRLDPIYIGDVWICSGQSNMNFLMRPYYPWSDGVLDWTNEVAAAGDAYLNIFTVIPEADSMPLDEVHGTWHPDTTTYAGYFSAIPYLFGRELRREVGVPVGIIVASLGATSISSWMSVESQEDISDAQYLINLHAGRLATYTNQIEAYYQDVVPAYRALSVTNHWIPTYAAAYGAPSNYPTWRYQPGGLYNAMLAPLEKTPVTGVVWCQGEADTAKYSVYYEYLSELISSWRDLRSESVLPFLVVQLANYDPTGDEKIWADFREEQAKVLSIPNTALVVAADVGDATNIHYRNKQAVAYRLGLAALSVAYGETNLVTSGPQFESLQPSGGELEVVFSDTGTGLLIDTNFATGSGPAFEVAGTDWEFHSAQCRISGDSVFLSSASVTAPVHVRYAYHNNPKLILYNEEGLPAVPFHASPAAGVLTDPEVKDVLGVIHVSGKYCFTTNDFLNEGANEIEALGTSVIKLWLNRYPAVNYAWNSDWGQYSFSNMVDLIQTPYYQNVINREQFKTILFVATEFRVGGYAGINWQDTVSTSEYQNCQQDFYNLTKYLLTNYVDSGKTFILQNWEGDNSLNFDVITNSTDRANRTAGMISWLDARQAGINQARDEVGMTRGVMVFGAAEVNQIPAAGKTFSWPTAIDTVIPYVNMDLYSYSDWATKSSGTETNLPVILDYIKDKAPASDYFDEDNIYLGEFGCYEMQSLGYVVDSHTDETDRVHREIVGKQLELALTWGVRYALYWEVYCNGLRTGITLASGEEAEESELVGVWLRRPDGSYAGAYKYFEDILPKNVDDYAAVYEVENQTVTVSSGDSHSEFESADLSGRYGSELTAGGVSDYIQYTLFVPSPGTYTVSLRYKASSDCGTFQMALDGVDLGSVVDAYASVSGYVTVALGTVNITTAGDKNFKLTVTGKNAASSGYNLALDYIKLSQTEVYEAESEITAVSSGDTASIFSGVELSGGYGSKLSANAVDDFIQYKVYVPDPGAYTVTVRYKSSPARGIFQPLIEGYNFGSTVDCYAAVSGYITVDLGTVNISTAGYKRFKFKVVGKNASSSDYDLAFDYLDLTLN